MVSVVYLSVLDLELPAVLAGSEICSLGRVHDNIQLQHQSVAIVPLALALTVALKIASHPDNLAVLQQNVVPDSEGRMVITVVGVMSCEAIPKSSLSRYKGP
jgi:hypothetical protein